ncbi:amino acid adenylation domain-containing protein [Colwellia sp. MSW7]|uniref:Amino acid adenylation domain-containing protein n=1 Tax=Colwellia maritima TaxID=2912588 RepID=A0ABS9X8R0_9GAMM|nr:non-ribosomal peptide synthetase [Colwellia maritima]MCI2286152.1 amino acid adenylation domain-containing protein [Colwellia maritima]
MDSGVTPGEVVAVIMPGSMEAVVSILAILKAGCTYLPLESSTPAERKYYILDNAGCHCMLHCDSSDSHENHRLLDKMNCISYSEFEQMLQKNEERDGAEAGVILQKKVISRSEIACLTYTSGSQGVPKGVLLPHSAIVNRLKWMWCRFPYSEQDICCQKTSLSFVDSVCELFSPLLQGIPLFIFTEEQIKNPYLMISILQREKITHIVLVPSLLKIFVDQAPEQVQQLKHLICRTVSGEVFPAMLYRRLKQLLPDVTVLNLYGCTEVMADVCCFEASGEEILTDSVPIGRAISGNEVYLLDENLYHTAIGETGEIYVAGENLARGYLHNSSLTEQAFIENPFIGRAGANISVRGKWQKMYRTGDIARRLPNGELEFIGRCDRQLKLRGQRFEPEEIETILFTDSRISQVALMPREYMEYPDLVAFYQSTHHEPLSESVFQSQLKDKLARSMWPTVWIYLNEWPVLAAGKTDYLALKRELDIRQPDVAGNERQNDVFARVKQLWQQVLQKEISDVDKTFFELGGNSLSLIQLHGLLKQNITQDVQPADLLQYPSIRYFSDYLAGPPRLDGNVGDSKNPRNRGESRRKAAHRKYRQTRRVK